MIRVGFKCFLFGLVGMILLTISIRQRSEVNAQFTSNPVLIILITFFWIGLLLVLAGLVRRVIAMIRR